MSTFQLNHKHNNNNNDDDNNRKALRSTWNINENICSEFFNHENDFERFHCRRNVEMSYSPESKNAAKK